MSFFGFLIRNRHCDGRSFPVPGYYFKLPTAHHFQPLPNVRQGNMWFGSLRQIKSGTVVLHSDHAAGIRVTCPDQNMKRVGIRVHAMLDGILRNGLQGQWWQTKTGKG